MNYNLISETTGEIVAHTIVYDCDVSTEEVLECRLENATDENLIPDDSYYWEKDKTKVGILI